MIPSYTIRRTFLYFLALITLPTSMYAQTDRSAQVDSIFQNFPGAAVLVVQDGRIVLQKGYGLANRETSEPVTPATNFRLASVSKAFTAMAVMILADQNKLDLDASLDAFFPGFPAYGRTITIRHLLNHTSGLLDYESLIPEGTMLPVRDLDVLHLLMDQDSTYFPSGSEYQYSNSGYAILALVVEQVSKTTFAQFLKTNIFDPLGMQNTIAFERGLSEVRHRALGYTRRPDGSFEGSDQSLTSSVLGDGGIYSSVNDLYKWALSVDTNQLVSERIHHQAFTPPLLPENRKTRYGFGWNVESDQGYHRIYHTGHTSGFSTYISVAPGIGSIIVILTNQRGVEWNEITPVLLEWFLSERE